MKVSKHFYLQEFLPKREYELFGPRALEIGLISRTAIQMAQFVREYFARPVRINDWHVGGRFQYRGFRPWDCNVGANYSLHRLGLADDLDVLGLEAEEVRQEIIQKPAVFKAAGITTLEANVNWLHIDSRPVNQAEILIVNG
ncbi:hypothetical protein AAG747_15355 [Rapidithrix thailandica]|uniref:Peptidase M15A C-terminal domain-containing protein n=1 Tax=Rapidithrix thailandica TaxID=413964 RepID=A0AAW9S9Z5_9BACT